MNNKIITIKNVRAYQAKNGVAQLNLEDVARGLGFTQIKGNTEYIRWETIKKYLEEFSFPTCWENKNSIATSSNDGKLPEYIPENIFYKLCFKAKNDIARKFQDIVTDEVLPSIRKNGMYVTNELLDNPDFAIKVFEQLKQEREQKKQLQLQNAQQKQLIGELKPKVDYLDRILKSKSVVPISYIAKDYGMTAQALNKRLHNLGIQYKVGNTWLLYREHQSFGYTHSKITEFERKDGTLDTSTTMEWTQKGRLFLYEVLKKNGIVPVIER